MFDRVGDEKVVTRRVHRWWGGRRWKWELWRTVEVDTRGGVLTTTVASTTVLVASGWARTNDQAAARGREALAITVPMLRPAPTEIPVEALNFHDGETEALVRQAIEAFRLTREYVEPKVRLSAVEGWSWFDAVVALRRYLFDRGYVDDLSEVWAPTNEDAAPDPSEVVDAIIVEDDTEYLRLLEERVNRTVERIEREQERIQTMDDFEPAGRWQFRRRWWLDGIRTARAVEEVKLESILHYLVCAQCGNR